MNFIIAREQIPKEAAKTRKNYQNKKSQSYHKYRNVWNILMVWNIDRLVKWKGNILQAIDFGNNVIYFNEKIPLAEAFLDSLLNEHENYSIFSIGLKEIIAT